MYETAFNDFEKCSISRRRSAGRDARDDFVQTLHEPGQILTGLLQIAPPRLKSENIIIISKTRRCNLKTFQIATI